VPKSTIGKHVRYGKVYGFWYLLYRNRVIRNSIYGNLKESRPLLLLSYISFLLAAKKQKQDTLNCFHRVKF
jgi:hypothetical protein